MPVRGCLLRREGLEYIPRGTHPKTLHFGALRHPGRLLCQVWALDRVAVRVSPPKR